MNDPTGQSIKGLFYLQHRELRLPCDTSIPHMGYIKVGGRLSEHSLEFPRNMEYCNTGGDFAINSAKLSQLRANTNVLNGIFGMPLVTRTVSELHP